MTTEWMRGKGMGHGRPAWSQPPRHDDTFKPHHERPILVSCWTCFWFASSSSSSSRAAVLGPVASSVAVVTGLRRLRSSKALGETVTRATRNTHHTTQVSPRPRPHFSVMSGKVTHLWRYAVKGLGPDEFQTVQLKRHGGMPSDRVWALHFDSLPDPKEPDPEAPIDRFDPQKPRWVHKQCFLAAFTAGELLAEFDTAFDDATQTLRVRRRHDQKTLLDARLDTPEGRDRVGSFFSGLPGSEGRSVRLVQSARGPHHFGNTPRGFKTPRRPNGHKSGFVVHLVNAATVRELSAKIGRPDSNTSGSAATNGEAPPPLQASRFRPNIVIDGVPAWEEFSWVGKKIKVGGAVLEVLSRTVRCAATNVDPRGGVLRADADMPALLRTHYPQHGPFFGVYARVHSPGKVRRDDSVEVLEPPQFGLLFWLQLIGYCLPLIAALWHWKVAPIMEF